MATPKDNLVLEEIKTSDIDGMTAEEAGAIVEAIESNTDWKDSAKNIMTNGQGMNC